MTKVLCSAVIGWALRVLPLMLEEGREARTEGEEEPASKRSEWAGSLGVGLRVSGGWSGWPGGGATGTAGEMEGIG